ncbi:hypothetical protein [Paenibacillus lutrae]|uniref:Uncharacterized protein n=1 Tax=Paenibacillus lutrae TaxID=2078573 RepID=A0A7X3FE45_9BACL|nr:hypothetical protein [Paenibacillus lutrae]MVO98054.1 hypothetical protein [Paenibacillus lutrae]
MDRSLQTSDLEKLIFNKKYWQYTGGDVDLFVKGSEKGPDEHYLAMAREIVSNMETHMESAVGFLKHFLKLEGEWSLYTADFGCCCSCVSHDFEFTIEFEEPGDPYKFVYTYFVVSFDIQKFGREPYVKPQRIEIGFR